MSCADPLAVAAPLQRLPLLDALRGLAALAVAWFHFTQGGLLPEGVLKSSGTYGWLGVEVFFVISGCVIPWALSQADYRWPADAGPYLLRRIIRLDPPYLVTIVLALVLWQLSALLPGFRGSPPQVEPLTLALHLGYLADVAGHPWIVPVFWSLAIEFQYYLLMALAWPVLGGRNRLHRLLGWLVLLGGVALLWPQPVWVFTYAPLFALGNLACARRQALLSWPAFLVLWAVLLGWTWYLKTPASAVVAGLTAMLIAGISFQPGRWLRTLGDWSYALYLVHVPVGGRVVNLGKRYADTPLEQLLVLAGALLASLVAAWMMYRWVELPARRWATRIRYGRARRAPN